MTARQKIQTLKTQYDHLQKGKTDLLQMITEAEIPESVYNSNAIENSTLTLEETEKILLEMEISRKISVREAFEAKNLARALDYLKTKNPPATPSENLTLFLHKILLSGIDDKIAGRFREKGEYVRVGTFIAPPPEFVGLRLEEIFTNYASDLETHFLDKITKFHLDFENLHPFVDGNGRIGRLLINIQLSQLGFPPVIIRNKERGLYNKAFVTYRTNGKTKIMEQLLALAILESLHKRLAYLQNKEIITVIEHAKKLKKPAPVLLNAAKRQTIPAFREKGIWKIASPEGVLAQ